MCRRVTCKTCGKPSWAGCGAHVDMVLGDVPAADRCRCREGGRVAATPTKVAAKPTQAPDAEPSAVARFTRWLRQ